MLRWRPWPQGQLGTGVRSVDPVLVPGTPVVGINNAASIAAGGELEDGGHTCAALPTGVVWCWGSDSSGQLGAGTVNVDVSDACEGGGGMQQVG